MFLFFFMLVVSRIVLLIGLFTVQKNTIFCILNLYSETLLNFFISSNSFQVPFGGFAMIMSPANTCSFPIWMSFLSIQFWLCWVLSAVLGLHRCTRPSLDRMSGGYSLAAVRGLLTVLASSVVDHGLQSVGASVVLVHRLTCPEACGIFLDQGLNPGPLHCKADY